MIHGNAFFWSTVITLFHSCTPSRSETKPHVNRVSSAVHFGFETRLAAEKAYCLAYAMGCVRVLPRYRNGRPPAAAVPVPEAIMRELSSAPEDFITAEWHVVFKGKRPGVYPAW